MLARQICCAVVLAVVAPAVAAVAAEPRAATARTAETSVVVVEPPAAVVERLPPAEPLLGAPLLGQPIQEYGAFDAPLVGYGPYASPGGVYVPFNPAASSVAGGSLLGPPSGPPLRAYGDDQPQPPPVIDDSGKVVLGFVYLVPQLSNTDFNRLVPPAAAADFPLLGANPPDSADYDYIPSFKLDYYQVNTDGLEFYGSLLKLNGDVLFTANDLAGEETLSASSDITSIVVAAPGIGFDLPADLPRAASQGRYSSGRFSIATMFASLTQHYNANLSRGTSKVAASAEQDFTGIGIRTAYTARTPLAGLGQVGEEAFATGGEPVPGLPFRLSLYSSVSGNFVVGRHKKKSSLAIQSPSLNDLDTINKDQSRFMVVGEVEGGVEWRFRYRRYEPLSDPTQPQSHFTIQAAFFGQLWSGAGLLDPLNPTADDGDLGIMGLVVKAGANW